MESNERGIKNACKTKNEMKHTRTKNEDSILFISIAIIMMLLFAKDVEAMTIDSKSMEFLLEENQDLATFSNRSYVILQQNNTGGINRLTQEMMPLEDGVNTVYIVTHDFIIDGSVTIPKNSILRFEGGSISGIKGRQNMLIGNKTVIEAGLTQLFGGYLGVVGSWDNPDAYPEWFGAKGDGVTDDSQAIQKTINAFDNVHFQNRTYIADNLIVEKASFFLKGEKNSTIKAKQGSDYILRIFVTYRKVGQRAISNLTFDCNNVSDNGLLLNCVQTKCENIIVLNPKSNGILANNNGFTVGAPFELLLNNIFIENRSSLTSSYNGIGINLDCSDCTVKDYVSVNMHISAIIGGANVIDNIHPYCGSPIFENSVGIQVNGLGNTISNCYFDCVFKGVIASRTTVLTNCKFYISEGLYKATNNSPVFITSLNDAIIYADHCYFENANNRSNNPFITNSSNVRLINPLRHPSLFFTSDNIEDYIVSNDVKERRYRINCNNIELSSKRSVSVDYVVQGVRSNDFYTLVSLGSSLPDGIICNSYLGKDKITIKFYNTTDSKVLISNSYYLTIRRSLDNKILRYEVVE